MVMRWHNKADDDENKISSCADDDELNQQRHNQR
jgi:hypothetical protein